MDPLSTFQAPPNSPVYSDTTVLDTEEEHLYFQAKVDLPCSLSAHITEPGPFNLGMGESHYSKAISNLFGLPWLSLGPSIDSDPHPITPTSHTSSEWSDFVIKETPLQPLDFPCPAFPEQIGGGACYQLISADRSGLLPSQSRLDPTLPDPTFPPPPTDSAVGMPLSPNHFPNFIDKDLSEPSRANNISSNLTGHIGLVAMPTLTSDEEEKVDGFLEDSRTQSLHDKVVVGQKRPHEEVESGAKRPRKAIEKGVGSFHK